MQRIDDVRVVVQRDTQQIDSGKDKGVRMDMREAQVDVRTSIVMGTGGSVTHGAGISDFSTHGWPASLSMRTNWVTLSVRLDEIKNAPAARSYIMSHQATGD